MQLELINGEFSPGEIAELLSALVRIKVNYHEQKTASGQSEEDLEHRERRIRQLQQQLQQVRNAVLSGSAPVRVSSTIELESPAMAEL